jgi:hypothetical protein
VAECLLSKHKALCSNAKTTHKKKKAGPGDLYIYNPWLLRGKGRRRISLGLAYAKKRETLSKKQTETKRTGV